MPPIKPFKTIVISGLVIKNRGRDIHDYADIDLVYNVEPSVNTDDIDYYLRNLGVRTAPVRTDGSKVSWVIGVDNDRRGDAVNGHKILNRVAFSKKFQKDLRNLDWNKPTRRK